MRREGAERAVYLDQDCLSVCMVHLKNSKKHSVKILIKISSSSVFSNYRRFGIDISKYTYVNAFYKHN